MDLRIGCSSWTSPSWKGRFYPKDLKDGDRLAYYARWFDAVEVDSTYYAAPNPFVVRGWARKTPDAFAFTVKMPRDLLDPKKPVARELLQDFVSSVHPLGSKLRVVLLQFPPWYKAGFQNHLRRILNDLPNGTRYAVELRDASWYDPNVLRGTLEELNSRSIGWTWSYLTYLDVPPELTTDFVYLRFIGDHTTVPEEQHGETRIDRRREIELWGARLKEAGVPSVFAFFNNHFAGFAPTSVNLLREYLGLAPIEWPAPAANHNGHQQTL